MIKNKKGQALVEFILILPILILLLLGMIDLGTLFIRKSELENKVADIIHIWQQERNSIQELNNLFQKENLETEILENTTTSFVTIKVKDKVNLITPIKKEYTIEIKRVIAFE